MGRFSAAALTLCLALAYFAAVQAKHGNAHANAHRNSHGNAHLNVHVQEVDGYAKMGDTKEVVEHVCASTHSTKRFASVNKVANGGSITVAADGSGDYKTVQAGVDAASSGSTITIKSGTYNERVIIPSTLSGVKIVGQGSPTIVCNSKAGDFGGDTRKAACVAIFANNAVITGVTFSNNFGWTNHRKGAQSPALLVYADKIAFYNCKIIGFQDTLFALQGHQYYKNCYIEGSVDFIFGDAAALFDSCTLFVKNNADNHAASLTAHYRQSSSEDTGFVFLGGSVNGDVQYKKRCPHLGRTWGPYATVVFAKVQFNVCINPEGWTFMKTSPKSYAKTANFYEFQNSGISTSGRVSWAHLDMTSSEQSHYLGTQFIGFSP